MIELGEPERTMRDGVPDGPGMCCGTCDRFEYRKTVRVNRWTVYVGICRGSCPMCGEVVAEYDGVDCTDWMEYEG